MHILIIILLFFIFYYIKYKLNLSIDLKSFFCKGFKKIDNQFGLFCFCGKQGKGKTYSMLKFAIDRKEKTDCIILTNIKSFKMFDDTIYFSDITELIDWVISYTSALPIGETPNILILFDEIFTILEKNTRINKEILSFISQLRKRNLVFCTTAQEWLEINITFRRYVRFQVNCNMISLPIFNTAIQINSVYDGEQLHWSDVDNDYVAPIIQTNISKCKLFVANSYDTYETINTSISRSKTSPKEIAEQKKDFEVEPRKIFPYLTK